MTDVDAYCVDFQKLILNGVFTAEDIVVKIR